MAKKKKKKNVQKQKVNVNSQALNQEASVSAEVEENNANVENKDVVKNDVVEEKPIKKPEKKQKQVKKEKRQSKIGKKIKESFGELKNVTWPTFPKVVKQTGVVLGVVVIFTLILFGFDYVLKFLFKLLNRTSYSSGELWASVGIVGAILVVIIVFIIIWAVKKKRGEKE